MTNFRTLILFICLTAVCVSCNNEADEDQAANNKPTEKAKLAEGGEEYENYITKIDTSSILNEGNSLYYTKEGGKSLELTLKLNEYNEIVRLTQLYTLESSGSIMTKRFYYKDAHLFASKEYFEEGYGESAYFVERVSYYDANDEVIATKRRTAPFEESLEQESFIVAENYKCSDETAKRALNQEGEFSTYFKGFIKDGPLTYVNVGELDENGYSTSLLVQYQTPVIQYLKLNEAEMKNKKVKVDFKTMQESGGYSFQSLNSILILND